MSADAPPTSAISKAGRQAITALAPPPIEDEISNVPSPTTPVPREQRKTIRHAANTAPQHRHGGGTGGFGSAIRSIDINGQHFELQNNSSGGAPAGRH
jgi:hypothetical protein